jgi:SPP1 gp7 family putative phage head morphogenesis protein
MNPLLLALVQAGIVTQADAERINRSLDPAAARAWAEQQLAIAAQSGLSAQQARLVDMVRRSNGSLSPAALDAFWAQEDDALWAAVRPTLVDITAENAIAMAVRMGAEGDMWRVVNERMLSWVDAYYTNADAAAVGSIPNLNLTSRTQFARAFTEWQRGELEIGTQAQGLPQLVEALTPVFGPDRAQVIATTETTRVIVESQRAASEQDEFITHYRYISAADERVCSQCGPLHGRTIEKSAAGYRNPETGEIAYPPLHPNCRCQLLEETSETIKQPLPPEERYEWSAGVYAEYIRNQRAAQRKPDAVRTLMGV